VPLYNGMYVYFECVFQRFGFSEHAYSPNATRIFRITFVVNGKWHGLQMCNSHALSFSIRSYSCTQLAWLQCHSELTIHTEVCTSKTMPRMRASGPQFETCVWREQRATKCTSRVQDASLGIILDFLHGFFAILSCTPECVLFKNCSEPEPCAHRDNAVKNANFGFKARAT